MTDLLNELQYLNQHAWKQHHEDVSTSINAAASSSASCPLLMDEVYSISSKPAGELSSTAAACAVANQASVSWKLQTPSSSSSASNSKTALQPSAGSFTSQSSDSMVANSAAVAAVAAYRRQYLGLDATLPGTAPGAAAGQQQKAQSSAKPSWALKSRPDGMLPMDFGPQHNSGYLSRPADPTEQLAVPNLPAKSGTAFALLPPARLLPGSCCPPAYAEPLVAMDPDARAIIAERQGQRLLHSGSLMNRLVYDSLQPPAGAAEVGGWCFSETCNSTASNSCRTTASGYSTRSNSTVHDEPAVSATIATETAAAALAAAREVQLQSDSSEAAAAAAYAPGTSPPWWYMPQGPDDPTLLFESRFECGNLRRAVQVYPYEYDLVLQPDINTRGHTQWYYFAVSNMRAGQAYRFNIINLLKEDSLYNMGMLPLMHSEQQMRDKGIGWVRSGCDVCYGPNSIKHKGKQTYFTLTFVMEFPHDNDLVHLAHCYPYSYTDLQNSLHVLFKEPSRGIVLQRYCMATSLAGNAIDVLTITGTSDRGKPMSQRQGVVLSARVHPGETNSSWMMKGALQQLLSSCAESAQLRENFVFKVVPMLNPDGVIVGNYRCSLAGLDLNRVWQHPDGRLQPGIAAMKDMIKAFMEEREVVFFCDMHGHSRKYGVFCYGCEKKAPRDTLPQAPGWPAPGSVGGLPGVPVRQQERIFPLMLYVNAPDLFSYRSCNFKVQKSKAGTGRVVGFSELGLVNSFTIEASFCGASVGKYAKQHFNTGHLEDMGSALVRTLLDYWAPQEVNSAAELSAQLATAGGSSSSTTSSTAAQSPLGMLLDVGGPGDEDDVCTDSDDESSEDEKPQTTAPTPQLSSTSSVKLQGSVVADEASAGSAAAAAAISKAATSASNVAQLNNQLLMLLSGATAAKTTAAVGGKWLAAGAPSGAASSPQAGSAVAALLLALKGAAPNNSTSSAPAAGTAAAAAMPATPSTSRSSSNNAGMRNQSSNNSSQEPSQAPAGAGADVAGAAAAAAAVAANAEAAKAAQQLLASLLAAKSKLQKPTATTTAAASAAAVVMLSTPDGTSSGSVLANTQQIGLNSTGTWASNDGIAATNTATSVFVAANPAAGPSNSNVCVGTGDSPQLNCSFEGTGPQSLTSSQPMAEDEAALASIPGLVELLQQLVDEHAALSAAAKAAGCGKRVGKGGKKKGRRRAVARYGNPEVLKAARAKADAGLAAALPELKCLFVDDDDEEVAAEAADDDAGNTSTSSTSVVYTGVFPPVADDSIGDWQLRTIRSGRRANICKGSQGCMLDAERYINLLDKQKRHTGGVLASSTIDNPWECSSSNINNQAAAVPNAAAAARVVLQLQQRVPTGQCAAAAGLSNGNSCNAAVAAVAASAGPGVSGEHYAVANPEPAAAGVTTGRRRRSKSAQAWLQDGFRRHPEAQRANTASELDKL